MSCEIKQNLRKISNLPPIHYAFAYIIFMVGFALLFFIKSKELGLRVGEEDGSYLSIVDSLYLSIVCITTLGFGDITPSTELGKVLVSIESLLGVFILGLYLNALSIAKSKEITDNEKNIDLGRKELLRKSLEMHSCLILDVFKTGNIFAWDKHAKYSAPMDELEDFARDTYLLIKNRSGKIGILQIKMILETMDQNYDTLLSLMPVAAEISAEYVLEWSSLISNVRNLKQQYEYAINNKSESGDILWPDMDEIGAQIMEYIQSCLFISLREKMKSDNE